jgi:hypothetical protein
MTAKAGERKHRKNKYPHPKRTHRTKKKLFEHQKNAGEKKPA